MTTEEYKQISDALKDAQYDIDKRLGDFIKFLQDLREEKNG